VIIGSLGTMIIGFSWLGWTLGSTAEKVAQQRTDVAVTSALTPICVPSFLKQSDATQKLTGLKGIDSWKQLGSPLRPYSAIARSSPKTTIQKAFR
jgi:hypothetical protein